MRSRLPVVITIRLAMASVCRYNICYLLSRLPHSSERMMAQRSIAMLALGVAPVSIRKRNDFTKTICSNKTRALARDRKVKCARLLLWPIM